MSDRRQHNSTKHGKLWLILCFAALMVSTMFVAQGRAQISEQRTVVPVIPDADRYQSDRVFLERADRLLSLPNTDYQVVVGNVEFRKGDMFMYCDSAHFYDQINSLNAYGNVRMEQGDTLFVYGDELCYTDSTELAVLYADPGKKVRLINRDVELRTDVFNYDMGIELGYYEVGGELIDGRNRLISVYGEYAPNTKEANFRDQVRLTSLSEGDTLRILTEALYYNTDTHVAEMTEESTVINADGIIYTDNGRYNTETSVADLYDRSLVVTRSGKTLTGDTLFYDRTAGYGEAFGRMELNDTVQRSMLKGNYGYYNELLDSAFVTGMALAIDYSGPDTLTLHGDTIRAFRVIKLDSITRKQQPTVEIIEEADVETVDTIIPEPAAVDPVVTYPAADITAAATDSAAIAIPSETEIAEIVAVDSVAAVIESAPGIEVVADTTHFIVAYPHVRFFRNDIQGVCDSMVFVQRDSMLHMHHDPVIWSGERQIFGDLIMVHMNDSTADRINLPNSGFMAEKIEDGYFNQMSGKEMVAYLENGQLRHLDVSGNVLIRFFPMENDSTYNKIAQVESSFLAADFKNAAIERLKLWSETTEVITPLYLAKRSLYFLPGFKWMDWLRPKSADDLFATPADPSIVPPADAEGESAVTADAESIAPAEIQNESADSESTDISHRHDDNTQSGGD